MRRLMLFSIGFTTGCAVGAYLFGGVWLLLLGVLALIGVFLGFRIKKPVVVAVLLGLLAGSVWSVGYEAHFLSVARQYDNQTVDGSITVTDYPSPTEYGFRVDGRILLDGRSYRVIFNLYQDIQVKPGDQISGTLRLRYTGVGGAAEDTYHQGKGIFLKGYFQQIEAITSVEQIPVKYRIAVFRQTIKNSMEKVFPPDTLGFVQALLLGDSSLLSYTDSTNLAISGIRHIIAVSGLHVSILYGVIYGILGYRRVLTPVVGFLMLPLFAALAGFTPSVVRACMMQGMMLLAQMVRKEYDPPTALSLAVLVILAVNPLTVTSVSFQLSVGCIIGIIKFSGRIRIWLLSRLAGNTAKGVKARLARWFASSVSVSLSTMIVTTPLSAVYFGTVSIVGLLTNLLTLWAVTWVFCGIIVACLMGALYLPLGKGIAWCISWLARYVMLTGRMAASFPLAAVYTESVYIKIWLVLCYVLMGAFLLWKRQKVKWLLGCILVSLCLAVGLSWLEPRLDDYRLTVLDVGQGQCVLLQNRGECYLVDCGGAGNATTADLAAKTLLSQGIFHLDGVILTHYDTDHAGAVPKLLTRIPADALYLPDVPDTGTVRSQLEAAYGERISWIGADEAFSIGDGLITVFSGSVKSSDNEKSLCVLFQPENCDILLTADRSAVGEQRLLEQTQLPELEVLVVGHHGAKNSACLELLAATWPEIAIISSDGDNSYGHPAPETLERLERFGCEILRTDLCGTIIIRG